MVQNFSFIFQALRVIGKEERDRRTLDSVKFYPSSCMKRSRFFYRFATRQCFSFTRVMTEERLRR